MTKRIVGCFLNGEIISKFPIDYQYIDNNTVINKDVIDMARDHLIEDQIIEPDQLGSVTFAFVEE